MPLVELGETGPEVIRPEFEGPKKAKLEVEKLEKIDLATKRSREGISEIGKPKKTNT